MELGNKIRELRLKKSATQEQLANELMVTAQCVSKWENGVTMPDIQLLPKLSAYFGVTIDELFDLTEDAHLERISHMLERERILDEAQFCQAESYLKDKAERDAGRGIYRTLLAELYNHMADGCRIRAEYWAKEALRLEPEYKWNHSLLRMAQQGAILDWNYANRAKRIAFYQQFVKEHPAGQGGILMLLEELAAANRLEEAQALLDEKREILGEVRAGIYEGILQWHGGRRQEALAVWRETTGRNPGDWLAHASAADCLAHAGQYREALPLYRRSLELQEKPRYTDSAIAMAQIYEILGDYPKAAEMWEEVIRILQDEHGIREGEVIDAPAREIRRLTAARENVPAR